MMQERKTQGNLTSEGSGPLPRCLAFWQEGLGGLCKPLSQLTLPGGHPGAYALTENTQGMLGRASQGCHSTLPLLGPLGSLGPRTQFEAPVVTPGLGWGCYCQPTAFERSGLLTARWGEAQPFPPWGVPFRPANPHTYGTAPTPVPFPHL